LATLRSAWVHHAIKAFWTVAYIKFKEKLCLYVVSMFLHGYSLVHIYFYGLQLLIAAVFLCI